MRLKEGRVSDIILAATLQELSYQKKTTNTASRRTKRSVSGGFYLIIQHEISLCESN
jgi:hypothetical protein